MWTRKSLHNIIRKIYRLTKKIETKYLLVISLVAICAGPLPRMSIKQKTDHKSVI